MQWIITKSNFTFKSFFIVLFILLPGLIVISCQSDKSEYFISPHGGADQVINNFTTVESDSGIVKWRMKAPVARIYNIRELLVTDSPVIEFFDKEGKVSSVITADKGEINQETRDLT
ncbi:LPS export ABC transporter periplasmic protein LptC, partial [bacterium]|nr:LPS export ABC transporter periplasmic protein LptC [bacterium]